MGRPSFTIGQPTLKLTAGFETGQVLNRAITYILQNVTYSDLCFFRRVLSHIKTHVKSAID